jgi:hypothetical protein
MIGAKIKNYVMSLELVKQNWQSEYLFLNKLLEVGKRTDQSLIWTR